MPVRRMSIEEGKRANLNRFPNFHWKNLKCIRKYLCKKKYLLVRCDYYYNVTDTLKIYNQATI